MQDISDCRIEIHLIGHKSVAVAWNVAQKLKISGTPMFSVKSQIWENPV